MWDCYVDEESGYGGLTPHFFLLELSVYCITVQLVYISSVIAVLALDYLCQFSIGTNTCEKSLEEVPNTHRTDQDLSEYT